jgi:hypothetical protein
MTYRRWVPVALVTLLVVVVFGPWLGRPRFGNEYIRFYGRIVDSSGRPIVGVTIKMEIVRFTSNHLLFSGDEVVITEVVWSNANGDFELKRGTGVSLIIRSMAKDGRELESTYARQDVRRPPEQFSYQRKSSPSEVPDTPARRLIYSVRY